MSADSGSSAAKLDVAGLRTVIVGKLAGMTKSAARKLLVARGAVVVDELDAEVRLIVVGEQDLPPSDLAERIEQTSPQPTAVRVVSETELWEALGVVEPRQQVHRLYTPAMLAELLGVPATVVRRWHRRGLIIPAREVRQLPYFDFCEVQTARRLTQLLAGGASPKTIEKQLTALGRLLPTVERPLAQLSIIVEGEALLLRQGDGLLEAGGQYRFDFGTADELHSTSPSESVSDVAPAPLPDLSGDLAPPRSAKRLCQTAVELEEMGRLAEAADLYRAALATGGLNAEICFALADVLYRLGDLGGARERYFTAVELNEDYVEARANLGCLLVEEKRFDLAIAAFQGALRYHDDYADVHYHLARALDEVGLSAEAEVHWRAFLALVPESPWAENARRRIGIAAVAEADSESGET
ncbi:MAG: tetratricopeptide repeat protein [Planctomycetia bacterium]|nr:tetratricopeptide repeat protein [Planctomycetia bacterium]